MSQSLNSTSSQKSTLVELPSSCMTTAEADEAKKRQNHKNRATREAKKLGKKLDNTIKELSETELLANKTPEEIVTLLVSSVALKGEDRGQVTRLAHVKLVQNKTNVIPQAQTTMNVSNVSIIEAEPLTKKQLKKQRQAAKVTTAVSASPKAKTSVLSSTVDWSFAKTWSTSSCREERLLGQRRRNSVPSVDKKARPKTQQALRNN